MLVGHERSQTLFSGGRGGMSGYLARFDERGDISHVNKTSDAISEIIICDKLKQLMSQDQQYYFGLRLMHSFLRRDDILASLGRTTNVAVDKLLRDVSDMYKTDDLKKQKEALDVAVILADWTYHNVTKPAGDLFASGTTCNHIGELLN